MMIRFLRPFAVIVCFLASPLAAQDFTIDAHAIDRCLGRNDHTPMACVGRQADVCFDTYGGGPNMVRAACQELELAHWDDVLNRTYARVLEHARDAQDADVGYLPDQLTNSVRDMQRAWIAYRDATCDLALVQAMPFGSAAGPAESGCNLRETARQVFQLQHIERSLRP